MVKGNNNMPGDDDLNREEYKALIKEAFTEWMDKKYEEFGKWTVNRLAALALSVFVVYLVTHGILK